MAQPPILSWEGLGLQQGGRWLFSDLDLHIGPRDRIALIGRETELALLNERLCDPECRWLTITGPGGVVPTELDRQYRFSAPELKGGSHRLDGVLWPLGCETGSEELPLVFLEVQMRADPGFHHRLAAQTFRLLQLHPPSSTGGWW